MTDSLYRKLPVVLATLVALAVFWVGQRHIPVSTDESIIALQARQLIHPPSDPAIRESLHPKPLLNRFPVLFKAQPYLFPLEAYIAAPLAPFLAAGPFGARIVPFAMGLATLWLSFSLLSKMGPLKDNWPGALLLVFPSAYVAIMQYGYALPSYPSHLLFLALGVWLTVRYIEKPDWPCAAALGICCAAALAGQLMSLPLGLMCGVFIFWRGEKWNRLLHPALFGVLSAFGLLPYILARRLYPGAYDAVSGSFPWREALQRIPDPLLSHVLPVASGIQSTVFPDNLRHVEFIPLLTRIWPFIWVALLSVGCLIWLFNFIRNRLRLEKDSGQAALMFFGLSVAAVFLFALSRRSHHHTYRYMVTAAWAFPFILAYLHIHLKWKIFRYALAGLAVLLGVLNAATLTRVMMHWTEPEFSGEEAWLYEAGPAIDYLLENNLTNVYASYHLAYRLTYGSGERITAAQYYNERFPGWPLPYREYVDQAEPAAYVMSPRFAISAEKFAEDLEAEGIDYTRVEAEQLSIFYDFVFDQPGEWLDTDSVKVEVSHGAERKAHLTDGVTTHRWFAGEAQHEDMWVSLHWEEPRTVHSLYVFSDFFRNDRPEAYTVEVRQESEWVPLAEEVESDLSPVFFDRGRPLYGHEFQRITLTPTHATGLRLRVHNPAEGRDWSIGELRLRVSNDEPVAE